LIYEVLWVRLFVLVMGGTVYSFTTVLVAFMAGLTLGGWLGGKYADRMKQSPLLVYGFLEGLIGFYCLLIPFLVSGLNPVFNRLYPLISAHDFAGILLRFFFSGLILVIPTTMMGATLPLLVRYSYNRAEEFGKTTGRLYALNTLGAVFGSLVSGMVLIPALGQGATLYLTAGINLLIFFSILVLWRLRGWEFGAARERLEVPEQERGLNFRAVLVLVLYGLSGAAAMIYQLAWTRALILSLGTTLYVLSLILTAYIAGLALGALAVTPLVDRVKRLWLWAGVLELWLGVSAWLVVPLFARLPLWMALAHRPGSYFSWMGLEFLAGFALIFTPTFMMGALLPLVVRLFGGLRGGVGSAVGEVYAWNTIGAILGSFVCGFFLIRWLGLKNSLVLASVLSLLIGAVFSFLEKERLVWRIPWPALALLLAAIFLKFLPGWDPQIINSGPYVYYDAYAQQGKNASELERSIKSESRTLYHEEGVEATVSVIETGSDNVIGLRINGKTDASSGRDMATQVITGHLAFLLNPLAKKAMLIGLASGVTLGSMLDHPLEEVTCLEISPEVVRASRYFNTINQRPLLDARTRLIINDGRFHLLHTQDRYDVIVSEPSNPWIGGMGLLFTREFFAQARQRLNPGGVMLAWVEIYDIDLESFRMIARTFINVFPEATLWESIFGGDYLMVGFNGPLRIDYSALKSQFANPRVRFDLARVGVGQPEKVAAKLVMGPKELAEFAGRGPLHSDDRRQLELDVPRLAYQTSFQQRIFPTMKALEQYRTSPEPYLQFSNSQDKSDLAAIDRFSMRGKLLMNAVILMVSGADVEKGVAMLEEAHRMDPEDSLAQESLYAYYSEKARTALVQGKAQAAINYYSQAWEYSSKGSLIPAVVGYYYLENNDFQQASLWAARALAQNPYNSLAWMLRGRIELMQGRPDLAFNCFSRGLENFSRFERTLKPAQISQTFNSIMPVNIRAEILFYMGEASRLQGKTPQALGYYVQAETAKSDYLDALMAGGKIFLDLGQAESAWKRFQKAVELKPENPDAHLWKALALERMPGKKQDALNELNKALQLAPRGWPERSRAEGKLSRLLTGQ